MEPNNPTYQPQENLSPQQPPKTGVVVFLKKHWFLLFLAAFATLLLILWIDGKNKTGVVEDLPNLPQITYSRFPAQILSSGVPVTLPTNLSLPLRVNFYQATPKALDREQAKALASNFAFPKEPSNISTEAVLGDHYLWLSGAQTLSVRLSPLEVKITPDSSVSLPPTEGQLPTEQAGAEFIKNVLSLNGLLGVGVDYSQVSSLPIALGDVLEVGLTPRVEGVAVVDANPTTPLIAGYIQKDNKLYALLYRAGFEKPANPVSYPAKNTKQLQESLVSEGKIVLLGDPKTEAEILVPTAISISTVASSLLFVPQQPTTLLPIYILKGVARTDQGEVPVYIYIPSVNSKYVRAL